MTKITVEIKDGIDSSFVQNSAALKEFFCSTNMCTYWSFSCIQSFLTFNIRSGLSFVFTKLHLASPSLDVTKNLISQHRLSWDLY